MQSAMFDGRRIKLPREFNPSRPAEDYLTFGYGQHWCIGAYIAMAQITATFKALLLKKGLRRASGREGRLRRITIYPAYLQVEFDS
jgi:cytochrome P450